MGGDFNAANIWGRVVDTHSGSSPGGKPFLGMQLNCTGRGGSVNVYGRLWGEARIEALSAHLKKEPDGLLRLRGFFSQYLSAGARMTNFSFYQWDPAPGQEPRAAFILRGEVVDAKTVDGQGLLKLKVVRKGRHGYKDVAETFDLWTTDPGRLEGMGAGQAWEVKGYLQQGEGEDEFGDASGPVRPYILQAKRVQ